MKHVSQRALNIATVIATVAFFVIWIIGRWGPHLMANGICYTYLGCNDGFFGYDALVHFLSGIMLALLIVWISQKWPKMSLFHGRSWKDFLVIVSLVALIAVGWEFGELCHDQFNVKILHKNLAALDELDQPTNDDTMGDMTFSIIGAALTTIALASTCTRRKDTVV